MDYSVHMLARAEHERMVRSLPPVPEDDYYAVERKSRKWHLPVLSIRLLLAAILHLVTK